MRGRVRYVLAAVALLTAACHPLPHWPGPTPGPREPLKDGTMRTDGLLATPEVEALAQREGDHQRWADDGGLTPEPGSLPPVAPVAATAVAARFGLPVRRVYRPAPPA